MTGSAWTFYKLTSGRVVSIANGIKPRNTNWLEREGLGVIAGYYDDKYYIDDAELQTVEIYKENELGFFVYEEQQASPEIPLDPHRKPLTENHIQPTPKLRTQSPIIDPQPISVDEELCISVGPETEIELFDTSGRMQSCFIVTDGVLEVSYTVPGLYKIMIDEARYLPVTIVVEVSE